MDYDFLVIGSSGMQGRIVVRDLLESGYKVFCADLYREGSEENLSKHSETPFEFIDLRQTDQFENFIKKNPARIVINCAEGDWNEEVYKICLQEGRHVIDLGSDVLVTKNQLAMSDDFYKKGLVAITGCGSTPGINNVMMKHASQFFKEIDTIEIGFAWNSNIKKFAVPFSIESIIEELTDPAPLLENGEWIERNPSDTEVIKEFREIGSQKCSLVRHPETYTFTQDYKHLNPQNIKFYAGFPDHSREVLARFIELGLCDRNPLSFEKTHIRPIDALSRILTRLVKPENYNEKENLWVEVSGKDHEKNIKITRMECLVSTIPGWQDAGCNIDTGFPASIIAQMILDGRITARGSFAPDSAVPVSEFFKELKKKGMIVYQDGLAIN